jgi:hypothetical protein
MKQLLKSLVLASSFVLAGTASAATITSFFDGFENENVSGSVLNYTNFSKWNNPQYPNPGTVDLKKQPDYGINCATGSFCVDLDGSTSNAGAIETKDFFAAGTYKVSFDISGNQRSSSADENDDLVAWFGGTNLMHLSGGSISWSDSWTTFNFVVNTNGGERLYIGSNSTDNVGLILDNVSVSAVPVPAAAFLMAPALIGFIGLRRKAAKKA